MGTEREGVIGPARFVTTRMTVMAIMDMESATKKGKEFLIRRSLDGENPQRKDEVVKLKDVEHAAQELTNALQPLVDTPEP